MTFSVMMRSWSCHQFPFELNVATLGPPRRCCEISPNGRYIAAGSDDARMAGGGRSKVDMQLLYSNEGTERFGVNMGFHGFFGLGVHAS